MSLLNPIIDYVFTRKRKYDMARKSGASATEPTACREVASLFMTVGHWLDQNDYDHEAHPEDSWYSMFFGSDRGDWRIVIECTETEITRRVLIYSAFPVRVPLARRIAVAEFMTRVNFKTIVGNFELDFSDGEVRFRTAADVGEGPMTPAILERILAANVRSSDRYLPALMRVAFGDIEPIQALSTPDDENVEVVETLQ